MFKLLCAVLDALDIPLSKLAAICTDGDSALMGRRSGLGARLREKVSYLLSVHCAAHKIALALKDTTNNQDQIKMLDKMLKAVHELFSKSGKRQHQWKCFAQKHGVTAFQFPLHNTTRWFSRAQGVRVLARNLPVLIKFLGKKKNKSGWETAEVLHSQLSDLYFVVLLHALDDVLHPLEHFRLYFEKDNNLPHKVPKQLNACKAALDDLVGVPNSKTTGGIAVQKFLKNVTKQLVWRVSKGLKVQLHSDDAYSIDAVRTFLQDLIEEVKENLDDRFPDQDILSAFAVFDPRSYSDLKQAQLAAFGTEEIHKLLKHFCAADNPQNLFGESASKSDAIAALSEFKKLKGLLWIAGQDGTSMYSFYRDLSDSHAMVLHHVLMFVHVCCVIPMNSSLCGAWVLSAQSDQEQAEEQVEDPSLRCVHACEVFWC